MRDFDWKIISTLHTYKNITKTANILFIAQPTLTKRIQLIEEELGVSLIVRTTKGITLTAEGEYVAKKAEQILKHIDEIKLNFTNVSGGTVGTLRIGVPNSYAVFIMPKLLKEFSQLYPNIKFDIEIAPSNEIIKLVENHEVNVGFARGSYTTSLEKTLLSEDQVYLVNSTPIDLNNLPELPRIDYAREPSLEQAITTWWNQKYDKNAFVRMQVNHGNTAIAMVKQGLGYAFFSDKNFFKDSPELFSIPLIFSNGSYFTRKTHLYYLKEEPYNQVSLNFINFAKNFEY